MSEMIYCQSCGLPFGNEYDRGTNFDGSKSGDYCAHCYQNGSFTQKMSMKEMVELNLKYLNPEYLDEWNTSSGQNMTIQNARAQLLEYMSTLKRWK